jgi:hypothetical protein
MAKSVMRAFEDGSKFMVGGFINVHSSQWIAYQPCG